MLTCRVDSDAIGTYKEAAAYHAFETITSPAEDCIGLGKNRGSYKNHPFHIKQVRERRLSICAGTVEWVT